MSIMPAACDVCGVTYSEYDGPCTEFAVYATDKQILSGKPPMCPGTVSLVATLEREILRLRAEAVSA